MESDRHRNQATVLIDSLRAAWALRKDYYAAANMGLYFSETQARNNDFRAPDFFVVLNTTRKERRFWVVWEEGGQTPDVVIELLSPSTESTDRGPKKHVYEKLLKVSEYFLYDPMSGALTGYDLSHVLGHYVEKEADERGWLYSRRLGLWLGKRRCTLYDVDGEWLHFFDEEGKPLLAPLELAEHERQRAEQEMQRAEQEMQRADHERARAGDAERRLAALIAKAREAGVELE